MEWRQCKSEGSVPIGRSSHSLNAVAQKLYVFGGENTPRVPVDNDMYVYDTAAECWSNVENNGNAPCPRIAHSSAVVGDHIYIFGGRTGITMGEGSLNDFHRFNTVTEKWEPLICFGDIPSPRSFHAMTALGKKIYIFGGCSPTGRLNDLHVCDVTTLTWSQLPSNDAILPRGGPGFVAVDDSLYVVAGFTGNEADDMYRFDLKQGTWSTIVAKPNIPCISVFGIASVGSLIFLHGGEVSPSAEGHAGAGQHSDVTYVYDTSSDQSEWRETSCKGKLPQSRAWHTACSLDNGIAIHGGNASDNQRLHDLHVMTVTTDS